MAAPGDGGSESLPEISARVVVDDGVNAAVGVGEQTEEAVDDGVEVRIGDAEVGPEEEVELDGEPWNCEHHHNQNEQTTCLSLLYARSEVGGMIWMSVNN